MSVSAATYILSVNSNVIIVPLAGREGRGEPGELALGIVSVWKFLVFFCPGASVAFIE